MSTTHDSATGGDYRVIQKVLHWLMGFFIILDLFVANKFGGEMLAADRLDSRMDHSTLGTTLAVLLLIRLYFRWRYGAAELPSSMSGWQKKLAGAVHVLLYVAMVSLITTGALTAIQATDPILIYNSIEITLGKLDPSSFVFVRQFHELMTWVMIGLIVLHVVAALFHKLVLKDDILDKMLKFWRSESSKA